MRGEIGRELRHLAIVVLVLCFANGLSVSSAGASAEDRKQRAGIEVASSLGPCAVPDAANFGWSLRLDDDGFAAHNREDRDYTAGLSFTFYDASERRLTAAVRTALRWMDKSTGFAQTDSCEGALQRTQISDVGLVLFSPDEIGRVDPSPADRPCTSRRTSPASAIPARATAASTSRTSRP